MSVNRRDLVRHFEKNGFFLEREGARHSIYSDGERKRIPIKRHRTFDRITANNLCKQAGIPQAF